MKITKEQLKKLIKEEFEEVFGEEKKDHVPMPHADIIKAHEDAGKKVPMRGALRDLADRFDNTPDGREKLRVYVDNLRT